MNLSLEASGTFIAFDTLDTLYDTWSDVVLRYLMNFLSPRFMYVDKMETIATGKVARKVSRFLLNQM